jgi:flavin reductase (DIM6/NTAB) family NADH-FMN oxidoreductase RutF
VSPGRTGAGAGASAGFHRTIDPREHAAREIYALMISAIVPRPIALTSTTDGAGRYNLAPFSYFMGVSSVPPILAISSVQRRGGQKKDTLRNIEATGEFVVNIVTEAMAEAMNVTSTDFPHGYDEFTSSGLTPLPSERVAAPRVAESPIQMECRLERIIEVGRQPAYLILGEVVLFHLSQEVLTDGRVDVAKLKPVARLGGSDYAHVRDVFSLARPTFRPLEGGT